MNAPLALLGAGMLCADRVDPMQRRALVLARSGRLRSPAARDRPSWPAAGGGVVLGAVVVGAAAVIAIASGIAIGVAFAVAIGTVVSLVRSSRRRAAAAQRSRSLLTALRLVVVELDVGARPPAALLAAAEVCPAHADAFQRAAAAVGDADVGSSFSHPELAPLGYAFDVATHTGATLGAVLSRVAEDLEQTHARDERLQALTAGPRSSAVLLALLPLVGLALGTSMGAHPLTVLFGGTAGQLLLGCGVGLDALGVLWTRRIVTKAERR